MHGGVQKSAGQKEIIQRIESDVRQRKDGHPSIGDLEAQNAGNQQPAQQQTARGQDNCGFVEIPGPGNGEIAASYQAEKRKLEEALDPEERVGAGARHDSILTFARHPGSGKRC